MARSSVMRLSLVLAGAVLAGCAKKDPAADQAAAPPSPPNVVHVEAADYSFTAPDTIPSGVTTLHLMNSGKELHQVVLVKLPLDSLMKLDPNKPPPSDLPIVGGANAAGPSGVAESTLDLAPGTYTMLCVIPAPDGAPHFMKGMIKTLIVTQGNSTAVLPSADVTVKLSDYAFDFSAPLTAGHHVLRIENAGPQQHEMVLVKLEAGKTAEDFAKWAEKPTGPPPGTPMNGGAPMAPGSVNVVPVDLTPGDYALICFFPDAKDGKAHAAHGMIKQITIS